MNEAAELPEGLWYQPEVDTSQIPAIAGVEAVRSIRVPARIEYLYTPGRAPTRFLRALAEKRIMGERCPVTGKVYVPPRGVSPVVGLPTEEQVQLGNRGTVTTFCVVGIAFTGQVTETPFVSALVLIDGADITLHGLIQEIPPGEVRSGMRVEAVWVPDDELDTSFENIRWWAPSGEPDVDLDTIREYL